MAVRWPERRRASRNPAKGLARVECRQIPLNTGTDLAVVTLDLSDSGLRLVTRQPLEPGELVDLALFAHGLARPARRTGRVVWSVPMAGGQACIGVAFEPALGRLWVQTAIVPPRQR